MTFDTEHENQAQQTTDGDMHMSNNAVNEGMPQERTVPQPPAPTDGDSVSVVAVALRAALWTIVAFVLLFGCFLTFFPYPAMRMYTTLDNKKMALYSAEKYMQRHPQAEGDVPDGIGKYADALYSAISNSVYLLDASISSHSDDKASKYGYDTEEAIYYAQKVDKYTAEYLRYNTAPGFYKRTVTIDEYNLLHSAPALHPYVYSYADYLQVTQFKAWTILGYTDQIVSYVGTATTGWNQSNGAAWSPSEDNFLLFAQLSGYLDVEFGRLGLNKLIYNSSNGILSVTDVKEQYLFGIEKPFDVFINDNGEFTGIGGYDDILYRYNEFVDFLRDHEKMYNPSLGGDRNVSKYLEYTYYLKSLNDFTQSMVNLSILLSNNNGFFDSDYRDTLKAMYDDGETGWWNIQSIKQQVYINGMGLRENVPIRDWYNLGMLAKYKEFFAAAV